MNTAVISSTWVLITPQSAADFLKDLNELVVGEGSFVFFDGEEEYVIPKLNVPLEVIESEVIEAKEHRGRRKWIITPDSQHEGRFTKFNLIIALFDSTQPNDYARKVRYRLEDGVIRLEYWPPGADITQADESGLASKGFTPLTTKVIFGQAEDPCT